MSKQDTDVVRGAFEAFGKPDFQWFTEHLAEDTLWHVPGHSSFSGDHRGQEALLQFFLRLSRTTGGTYKQDLQEVFGGRGHAVALSVETAQAPDGTRFTERQAFMFYLEAGLIKEVRIFLEDEAAADAFFNKLAHLEKAGLTAAGVAEGGR
ncbi:MAG: nuclear transport factor 2 family protein [Actinomycetota bacterium]